MPSLFDRLRLRGLDLRNRIVMSPMCMYMAGEDGRATDFHLAHYGARALGGVALIIVEATAVESRGRISVNDLGLWDDSQVAPLARVAAFVRSQGARLCVQLAHAGRKAWSTPKGVGPLPAVAPSAVAFADDWVTPQELSEQEIEAIMAAWRAAAQRALEAGVDAIEVHGAHGYLAHEFLSPLANRRRDGYGGDLQQRTRFLLGVVEAVRSVLPAEKPLLVRLSCTDWAEGGLTVEDTVQVARILKERGVDLVDCSSGGMVMNQGLRPWPGYQIPFAERLKREAGIATGAVGLISMPEMAEEVVRNSRADVVLLGRELLRDPHWPLHAARQLGVDVEWPTPYRRGKR